MRQGRCVVLFILMNALVAVAHPPQQGQAAPDESTVKQIVDGYMKQFLGQHKIPGAIVAVSIKGHEYFFPYGKATDSGEPFKPDTLAEIGSCTKTFTTTLFALALNEHHRSRPAVHAGRLQTSTRRATDDAAGTRRLYLRLA
jgi:CubicO group peptidase (beta-lactamase class C family)